MQIKRDFVCLALTEATYSGDKISLWPYHFKVIPTHYSSSSEERFLSMDSQDFATGGSITVIEYKIIPVLSIQKDFLKNIT